ETSRHIKMLSRVITVRSEPRDFRNPPRNRSVWGYGNSRTGGLRTRRRSGPGGRGDEERAEIADVGLSGPGDDGVAERFEKARRVARVQRTLWIEPERARPGERVRPEQRAGAVGDAVVAVGVAGDRPGVGR